MAAGADNTSKAAVNTAKPSAVFQPQGPRNFTLSIALPGSIVAKYVYELSHMKKNLQSETSEIDDLRPLARITCPPPMIDFPTTTLPQTYVRE